MKLKALLSRAGTLTVFGATFAGEALFTVPEAFLGLWSYLFGKWDRDDVEMARWFSLKADETNDAADHDELHAAAEVACMMLGAPYEAKYINRWMEELYKRHKDQKGSESE